MQQSDGMYQSWTIFDTHLNWATNLNCYKGFWMLSLPTRKMRMSFPTKYLVQHLVNNHTYVHMLLLLLLLLFWPFFAFSKQLCPCPHGFIINFWTFLSSEETRKSSFSWPWTLMEMAVNSRSPDTNP